MAHWRRMMAVAIRYFYLVRGSPARVVPLFAWVGIDMILWGFMSRYLNSLASPGFNFIPALLGAVLLWDLLIRIMQGVTMAFFEDVWSRNFLNMFGVLYRSRNTSAGWSSRAWRPASWGWRSCWRCSATPW